MSNGGYFGKYRGVVVDNGDPQKRGRILAKVPDAFGDEINPSWALPALPYAGKDVGLFLIPPVDANIWIEFEQGDLENPIWTGCFWPEGEVPANNGSADIKILKTESCTIKLDNSVGSAGITIELNGGMKITLDSGGIEINDGQGGKIKLSGPQVSVNDGALEVV